MAMNGVCVCVWTSRTSSHFAGVLRGQLPENQDSSVPPEHPTQRVLSSSTNYSCPGILNGVSLSR